MWKNIWIWGIQGRTRMGKYRNICSSQEPQGEGDLGITPGWGALGELSSAMVVALLEEWERCLHLPGEGGSDTPAPC